MALLQGGHREHLSSAQHLPETLVLAKEEGALAALVEVWQEHGAAHRETELITHEGRDAAGVCRAAPVEEVARIESGVADKFKHRTVQSAGSGLGDDVGEAGGPGAHFGGHHAGIGANLLDGVHVKVSKRRPAQFRVGRINTVDGKNRAGAALAVNGKLLREVSRAVRIRRGAGAERQQLGEVTLVERQAGDLLTGELGAVPFRLDERRTRSRSRRERRGLVAIA